MSISISKIVNLQQAALKFLVKEETEDEPRRDFYTIGGVFSDSDYAWLSNGPRLEVVNTKSGNKIGAWTFGWVLKDVHTEVVCVDEIQRPHGRPSLLVVGVDCGYSGGMICIFDFITSKIIRAIQMKDKITKLHVIDAGHDVFTLPSPLRNFDGIIAVGTTGGDVFLVDICRQICDEALTAGGLSEIRDELNPCQLNDITSKDIGKIEIHKEFAVRHSQHLAIHLNIVFEKSKHFTLKGPKGDDRIHVNKDEVTVSALCYCPQLGSLLIGYNFGALQLYNLMSLELVYTSPVCDEHIPISHFAVQEPSDDPRAFCYIWAVYSGDEQYSTSLPLAVLYAFSYHTKEYHEGYGFLYQDFNTARVHYQMELGVPEEYKKNKKPKGGYCLKLSSISQGSVNKEGPHCESNEDSLTLCVMVWNVWYSNQETDTFVTLFDLNQWYKEQMPNVPNAEYSSTYMFQMFISNLLNSSSNKSLPVIDAHVVKNSMQQYMGAQKLEEHFCPNSLSFDMCCLRENDIIYIHNYGVQKALLAQIESSGPLCLVEPAEIYQEIIGIGLIPLFIDLPVNAPVTTNQQREIILGAALENQLMGWLCKCASEWANGSYLSTGCSLDLLLSWAFQRAASIKTNCDKFCVPLFDYSQVRLDNNTNVLLNSCTRQLKNVCSLYAFIVRKLYMFISNQELVEGQFKSLQTVSVYFEVLQWLLNVGLLPECPLTAYPRSDDLDRINAPYPAEMLIDFYNHRRGILKILNEENFSSLSTVLFIDNLIEKKCGGETLEEQWRNDGGNGLYPPPSLQALLRTYLVDNVELSYKHSVIMYVFLDLAMTLDQDRYKPVITHLIKFPAVFKVSPSLIKITQAFWQLDHGDYNTAMGLLLDPLVLNEDLTHWHHKVALRSLLLQKQHNFALLYVQVRRPTLNDDEDVLTAITLYVANNMLDEAFYFEKHFINHSDGEKFLTHLFNECKKNNKLWSIIYRSLSAANEKSFLKYLVNSKNATAEDLHVYYHILRSHYIEAFESHERTVPNQIENQGLIGQENAVPRDKLVHYLKKLLPAVNRNLLNMCHREKNNIWQQVSKPTPLSVFIHNVNENVQYKSTLMGAALAKAKQTFNETVSDKFKLDTEGTPFLRTPRVSTSLKRSSAIVITPKVTTVEKEVDEIESPPSAKRLKLSPRARSTSLMTASIPSKLETPLVKRKLSNAQSSTEDKAAVSTPHSILKVKSLSTPKGNENSFEDDFKAFEKLEYTPVTSRKVGLGLSPRKSLVRASPVVRFEGLKSSSSSSLNTSRNLSGSIEKVEVSGVNISSNEQRLSAASSKNSSTEEEIFYSPDTSLEDKQVTVETKTVHLNEKEENEINESLLLNINDKKTTEVSVKSLNDSTAEPTNDELAVSVEENQSSSPVFSPKSRRSYKRSLTSLTPVRSSPRLSKTAVLKETPISSPRTSLKNEVNEDSLSLNEISSSDVSSKKSSLNTTESESVSSENEISRSNLLPKLRPRKSLCRKVLEINTVNKILGSPLNSPRSRRSTKDVAEVQEISKTEESVETVHLVSSIKYADGEESYTSSMIKKHNLTTSATESDLETSADFSIKYDTVEVPKLSESMLRYINTSESISEIEEKDTDKQAKENQDSIVSAEAEERNNEVTKKLEDKNASDEILQDSLVNESNMQVTNVTNNDQTNINSAPSEINVSNGPLLENESECEISKVNDVADSEAFPDKNVDLNNTAISVRNQSAYSAFESSVELFSTLSESGPKLSESMIRCINNRVTTSEDKPQNEALVEDEEAMDVDDYNDDDDADVGQDLSENQDREENNHNEQDNELVYKDLPSSKEDESKEQTEEGNSSKHRENKEEQQEESFDTESSTNRPVDPEMNVFEISDDLSINEGVVIEKEVTLEENDLCYDQQNTLECVLEENITGVSSTPLNAFEKNVFNEISSEDESDSFEGQGHDLEEEGKPDETINKPEVADTSENEVIEIGSSSDEYEKSNVSEYGSEGSGDENSYIYEETDEEIQDTSFEGNVYDTEDYSSESRYHSSDGENEDDLKSDENKTDVGLVHAEILIDDDEDPKMIDENVEKPVDTTECEQPKVNENESLPVEDKELKHHSKDADKNDEKTEEIPLQNDNVGETQIENKPNQDEQVEETEVKLFSEYDSLEKKINEDKTQKTQIDEDSLELDQTEMKGGLFYGDILIDDDEDPKIDEHVEKSADKTECEESKVYENETPPIEDKELERNSKDADSNDETVEEVPIQDDNISETQTENKPNQDKQVEVELFSEYDSFEKKINEDEEQKMQIGEDSFKLDQTEEKGGLFYGDILIHDDEDPKINENVEKAADNTESEEPKVYENETPPMEDEELERNSKDADSNDEKVEQVPLQDDNISEIQTENKPSQEEQVEEANVKLFSEYDSFDKKVNEDEERKTQIGDGSLNLNQTAMKDGQFYGDILSEGDKSDIKQGENQSVVESKAVVICDTKVVEKMEFETKVDEKAKGESKQEKDVNVSKEELVKKTDEKNEQSDNLEQQNSKNAEKEDSVVEKRREDITYVHKVDKTVKKESDRIVKEIPIVAESEVKKDNTQSSDVKDKDSEVEPADGERETDELTIKPRTRASSVSSTKSEKSTRKTRQTVQSGEQNVTPRRSTRRSSVTLESEKSDVKSEKSTDDIAEALPFTQSSRSLRTRRVSTEESRKPVKTLRKRSASVDEISTSNSKKEDEIEVMKEKGGGQRASSVSRLPKISEENDDNIPQVKRKRSKSVLENYSMTRRMTRQQINLLKKTGDNLGNEKNIGLVNFDPTVVLERLPLEGTPDFEEKKNVETSPSSSNSAPSTPKRSTRRLRSASQASEEGSPRSKSKTPVRSVKRGSRKGSTDELSNLSTQSNKGTSKADSIESVNNPEDNAVVIEPRTTRSRARSASVSSVNSDDSNISETQKGGRRRPRLTSQSNLPEIKEELGENEKSAIPRKRTRQNSSQK